jgi:hypothetical protein
VTKIRKDNHVFVSWKSDHGPRHVHDYRDGKLVVKWDLENNTAMKGKTTRRVLHLIKVLEAEGRL